jgi:hypothetical protein
VCRHNIWNELNQIFYFFLSPSFVCTHDCVVSSSTQMPAPPGHLEKVPGWLCKCAKCGPAGKEVPRRTWYNHNPGGKNGKRPELSQGRIDFLLGLPAAEFSRRRKKDSGGVNYADHAHISKRNVGSSLVRVRLDHDICTSFVRY